MHFDSDDAVDGRRLSAIFYLNPGTASSFYCLHQASDGYAGQLQ